MSLVEAARFYNSFEAGLAQSRLEDAGIDSVLFDLEMATYGIGLSIPVRLMVLDDDLDVAIKALDLPEN
jgi:Putative prokaryotic signal transducing protein